jgi:RimJ/RimL family protein N-acetyltransferase
VKLLALDSPALIELAAGWLAQKENYQWLDLGNGRPLITPTLLKIMTQRGNHLLRAYTSDRDDTPIGLVALSNIDRGFGSALFWGASGEKSFRYRGYSSFASSQLFTLGFRDLGLHSIHTWVVEHNPSARTVERLNFRFAGRQRQCHGIDGRLYDRLIYDLLASEHRELEREARRREMNHEFAGAL